MNELARELLISTGMVLLTVLTHLVGLNLLIHLTRIHVTRFATPVHVDRVLVPLGMVLGIFLIHGVEIWAYAVLYLAAHAVANLEEALYFSIGAYTSTGWIDVHLTPGWRVVMSLEAITGLLMVGWSTAFFFHNLTRLMLTEETHPLPGGAIAKEATKALPRGAASPPGPSTPHRPRAPADRAGDRRQGRTPGSPN